MKFQLSTLLQEIHAYLLLRGTNINLMYIKHVLCIVCTHRQRVESLILSSQISTNPQTRVFLSGDTVQLTFNIGMVCMSICEYAVV